MIRFCVLTILVLLPAAARAQGGPSFDCARARAWDERQICAQADLSELDRRIAAAWRSLMDRLAAEERARLQAEQRAWLGERRGCEGPDARQAQSCLRRVLRARSRDLEAMAGAAPAAALPASKPPPAAASPPIGLRPVACPGTPGWVAAQICATPGMQALDAAVLREAADARVRIARNPAAATQLEALLARYLAAREACARTPGRVPLDCLQETMEEAQAQIRRMR